MKKNLVIVAHPDDETIWMGGTILKKQKAEWTILSLCRSSDQDRKPRFQKVCEYYNASPIISDLEDKELAPIPIKEIEEKIISLLPEKEFDNVYTHGENGEYGHLRHKEIHQAVKMLIKNKELKCKKIFAFSYIPGESSPPNSPKLKIPIPNKDADEYMHLSEDNFKKKIMLVKEIYGFGGDSFEVLSCNNFEAFQII